MALAWRLRYRVFNRELGWAIKDQDLLEIDGFDNDASHFAVVEGSQLVGYWRAIRTDRPYLLDTEFPELFGDRPPIKSSDVWEISRLVIEPDHPDRRQIGRALASGFVKHGRDHSAKSVIGITDPRFHLFLKRCGFEMQTLTRPHHVGESSRGTVEALISECPINNKNIKAADLVSGDFAQAEEALQ
ncbi:MAG: GNAT family N-acetyltransferase [Alphaproteobacteria bacterium]|nr:GNAT family N-acetyltransferase [Alphaproteobacteria bacterium SS10]